MSKHYYFEGSHEIICNINPEVDRTSIKNVWEGEYCSGIAGREKCKNCVARKVEQPKHFNKRIKLENRNTNPKGLPVGERYPS